MLLSREGKKPLQARKSRRMKINFFLHWGACVCGIALLFRLKDYVQRSAESILRLQGLFKGPLQRPEVHVAREFPKEPSTTHSKVWRRVFTSLKTARTRECVQFARMFRCQCLKGTSQAFFFMWPEWKRPSKNKDCVLISSFLSPTERPSGLHGISRWFPSLKCLHLTNNNNNVLKPPESWLTLTRLFYLSVLIMFNVFLMLLYLIVFFMLSTLVSTI